MTGHIVAFSGVDCAGKSTQISRTRLWLESLGKTVCVFWYRPGYSRELDALRAAIRHLRPSSLPRANHEGSEARSQAFSRPSVQLTWVALALADLTAQYGARLRHLRSTHDVVLCDRALMDARFDFQLRFPRLEWMWRPSIRATDALMPSIDAHFLLILDHEEMIRRQAEKQEPFPDAPEVRDVRYALYRETAAASEMDARITVIDSSDSVESVHAQVRAVLAERGVVDGPA